MSHVVVIIQRAPASTMDAAHEDQVSYEYTIPVPHGSTPQQVGELVRKAYKRLENSDD